MRLAILLCLVACSGSPAAPRRQPPPATYQNPIWDTDFPDPTLLDAADGWIYAYATQGPVAGAMHNLQIGRSRDLLRWERLPDGMPERPRWASHTQKFWAPHVVERDGAYILYFSAEHDRRDGHCVGAARASSPAGPFVDAGEPIVCGKGFVHIDPMAFDDPRTGKRLLYWGSGFEPIRVQELAPDRVRLASGTAPIMLVGSDPAERYGRLVEGAWVVYRAPWYVLFYSGDNCCGAEAHYAILAARSREATGPFTSLAAAERRPTSAIVEANDRWNAPGHNAVYTDRAGTDWLVYHAIDRRHPHLDGKIEGDRDVRRVLLLDRITWSDGWPTAPGAPSSGHRPLAHR